eukprot:3107365-Alexandrium_andersonii.AAC.1
MRRPRPLLRELGPLPAFPSLVSAYAKDLEGLDGLESFCEELQDKLDGNEISEKRLTPMHEVEAKDNELQGIVSPGVSGSVRNG